MTAQSNTATTSGGIIYVNTNSGCSSAVTFVGSTLRTNTATNNYGGIAYLACSNTNSFTINGVSIIDTASAG